MKRRVSGVQWVWLGIILVIAGAGYGCGSSVTSAVTGSSASTGGSSGGSSGGAAPAVTFSGTVMGIFAANGCMASRCHGGGSTSGGLDLSSASVAFNELLGKNGAGSDNGPVVIVSSESTSILVKKLRSATKPFGDVMPQVGTPIIDADLQSIKSWIASGAPNN